jgi:hypothetical protein
MSAVRRIVLGNVPEGCEEETLLGKIPRRARKKPVMSTPLFREGAADEASYRDGRFRRRPSRRAVGELLSTSFPETTENLRARPGGVSTKEGTDA